MCGLFGSYQNRSVRTVQSYLLLWEMRTRSERAQTMPDLSRFDYSSREAVFCLTPVLDSEHFQLLVLCFMIFVFALFLPLVEMPFHVSLVMMARSRSLLMEFLLVLCVCNTEKIDRRE